MARTITNEQYSTIIDYANQIYAREVEPKVYEKAFGANCRKPKYVGFDLSTFRRVFTIDAYKRHKPAFKSENERIIFFLNLLIPNNTGFAKTFTKACELHFQICDVRKLNDLYNERNNINIKERWNTMLNQLATAFYVTPEQARLKIVEILQFANVYYQMDYDDKEPTKVL